MFVPWRVYESGWRTQLKMKIHTSVCLFLLSIYLVGAQPPPCYSFFKCHLEGKMIIRCSCARHETQPSYPLEVRILVTTYKNPWRGGSTNPNSYKNTMFTRQAARM